MSPLASLKGSPIRPKRSRRGCRTCKIRKVKCGEEKPNCIRCTSTGRKCEYEGKALGTFSSASSATSMLDSPLSLSPNTVWRERRSFAYYFQHAAPFVGGSLDVDFWRVIVPQVCRSEPAVWDAIIAISALFESPDPCPDLALERGREIRTLNQNHRDALTWYSRSVSAVRQRIERGDVDIFVGLVSCILFICIEALQGALAEAAQLYDQGIRLICALRAQTASGTVPAAKIAWLEDTIVPIFVYLGAIGYSIALVPVGSLLPCSDPAMALEFPSLKLARDIIILLAAEIQIFQRVCDDNFVQSHASQVSQDLKLRQMVLSAKLKKWHLAFINLKESLRKRNALTPQDIGTGALLFSYHETLFIMLGTCMSPSQITTDAYLPNFQNIVDQCGIALDATAQSDSTQPPFTFGISVGLPLWFTSLRCRDPRIRRAAVALLRRAPQVQGLYKCAAGVSLAETVMMLEEKDGIESSPNSLHPGTVETTPAVFVPEEARLGPIGVIDLDNGIPPDMTDEEVHKWNQRGCRNFLRISRDQCDLASDTWQRVHEYILLDH
ncbi:hypothetical protein BDV25DRAFT_149993 [Aspergillus avenaceus]|uniref:Zn(2)-C6 fungal-type domain-containing protein n=1 Tax=Aspergillus avenaceus TaxID=36643 RepID=A0A5N6U3A0_ASPAV|nr:hypothetical protein BDV25DRAFT_149993 [Aspergillus avenaceus]